LAPVFIQVQLVIAHFTLSNMTLLPTIFKGNLNNSQLLSKQNLSLHSLITTMKISYY